MTNKNSTQNMLQTSCRSTAILHGSMWNQYVTSVFCGFATCTMMPRSCSQICALGCCNYFNKKAVIWTCKVVVHAATCSLPKLMFVQWLSHKLQIELLIRWSKELLPLVQLTSVNSTLTGPKKFIELSGGLYETRFIKTPEQTTD